MIGGYQSKTRCSRPRITNKRTDKLIKRMVVASPGISSKEIRQNLNGLPQKLSERTIRHRLNTTLGLKAYRPAKKPLLSRKNVADRLRFARQHLNWTAEDWANVMFSDETIIAQFFGWTHDDQATSKAALQQKIHGSDSEASQYRHDLVMYCLLRTW